MLADGKQIAAEMEKELAERLRAEPRKKLCFIIFGSDAASLQFVKRKSAVAERLGIAVEILQQPENISTDNAVAVVKNAANEKSGNIGIGRPSADIADSPEPSK